MSELPETKKKPASSAHIPKIDKTYSNSYNGSVYNWSTWGYDVVVFLFNILFSIFFREITIRGAYKLPKEGVPTILVCAPHANQFIDPTIVMVETRKLLNGRGRQACFVTAESSLKMKVVGFFGRLVGSIGVPRAQDNLKPVDDNIEIYTPNFKEDPCLIKGRCKDGKSSPKFTTRFTVKSLIGLPNYLSNAQIGEIIDDETIKLAQPFKSTNPLVEKLLTQGTNFKYAPKIDNSKVFQNVFNHLHTNGTVGIFPEGGSHDRPSLLPIKAGVVIMALGAVAADKNMKINIVPVGLHYFHRHKFRSRAVIEYGEPIIVDGVMGEEYIQAPRATVSKLLKIVTDSLMSVTENAPDFDTLMTIQAARRLFQTYETNGKHKFSLPLVVEINRRLLVGYSKYKDDERIINLKDMVSQYNNILKSYGLKDHQVEQLKSTTFLGYLRCLGLLLERIIRLVVFFILSLPGSILFTPVFILCDIYSKKRQREGLKKSLVKIKGLDLLATWKLIVALILGPILYVTYSILGVWIYNKDIRYLNWIKLPFDNKFLQFIFIYGLLVFTTYASLKTGEIGMDLLKSIRPLFLSLIYPNDKISTLKYFRRQLSLEITAICNELGPQVFKDYDKFKVEYLNADKIKEIEKTVKVYPNRSRSSSVGSMESDLSNALSRVSSRSSLSDMSIFNEPSIEYGSIEDELTPSGDGQDGETIEEPITLATKRNYPSRISNLVREKWNDVEDEHIKRE